MIGCPVFTPNSEEGGRKQSEAEVRMGAELLGNCGILKKKKKKVLCLLFKSYKDKQALLKANVSLQMMQESVVEVAQERPVSVLILKQCRRRCEVN